jgi:hypothetical protein
LIVYKLVKFYEPGSSEEYISTRVTLTVFSTHRIYCARHQYSCFILAIVAFLLLSASFAIGLKCYLDFDQGLVESKVNSELIFNTVRPGVLKYVRYSKAPELYEKAIFKSRKYVPGLPSWCASHSPNFDRIGGSHLACFMISLYIHTHIYGRVVDDVITDLCLSS